MLCNTTREACVNKSSLFPLKTVRTRSVSFVNASPCGFASSVLKIPLSSAGNVLAESFVMKMFTPGFGVRNRKLRSQWRGTKDPNRSMCLCFSSLLLATS